MKAVLDPAFVGRRLRLRAQVFDGTGQETAGAAGRVEDGLAQARVNLLDNKLGHGARCVKLAGVTGRLQVAQELFVDVAKEMAILAGVKVDPVDLVDDLAEERTVFHVVVGVGKGRADQDRSLSPPATGNDLSLGKSVC